MNGGRGTADDNNAIPNDFVNEGRNVIEDMAVSTEASRSDCSVANDNLESDHESNAVCLTSGSFETSMANPSPALTWGSVVSSISAESMQDSKFCVNGNDSSRREQCLIPTGNNHIVTSNDEIYEGIGPCIPPGVMITCCSDQEDSSGDIDMEAIGPMPPPPSLNVSDDDNSDFGKDIGPLPFSGESDSAALEYARLRMQLEDNEDENKPKREDWMLKVPKKSVTSKSDARHFKRGNTANAEFDESWEETPHSKKIRIEGSTGADHRAADSMRDEEQRKILESFDVERQRLAEVPRNAEETKIKGERVPFDREKDIGEGSKTKLSLSEVKGRLGNLDSRFAAGSGQKFL